MVQNFTRQQKFCSKAVCHLFCSLIFLIHVRFICFTCLGNVMIQFMGQCKNLLVIINCRVQSNKDHLVGTCFKSCNISICMRFLACQKRILTNCNSFLLKQHEQIACNRGINNSKLSSLLISSFLDFINLQFSQYDVFIHGVRPFSA